MEIYENKSQFVWPEHNGIGENLIQQILSGKKTATACPKTLYSEEEIALKRRKAGHRD
ncbi:MAG: hypothetical protein AB7F59_00840 [Bdellovibrionales bacterium]